MKKVFFLLLFFCFLPISDARENVFFGDFNDVFYWNLSHSEANSGGSSVAEISSGVAHLSANSRFTSEYGDGQAHAAMISQSIVNMTGVTTVTFNITHFGAFEYGSGSINIAAYCGGNSMYQSTGGTQNGTTISYNANNNLVGLQTISFICSVDADQYDYCQGSVDVYIDDVSAISEYYGSGGNETGGNNTENVTVPINITLPTIPDDPFNYTPSDPNLNFTFVQDYKNFVNYTVGGFFSIIIAAENLILFPFNWFNDLVIQLQTFVDDFVLNEYHEILADICGPIWAGAPAWFVMLFNLGVFLLVILIVFEKV